MFETLLGMVTLVNQMQPANAKSPMLVTLLGMVNPPGFPPGYSIRTVWALLYSTPSWLL